jgi:hypothetical protein
MEFRRKSLHLSNLIDREHLQHVCRATLGCTEISRHGDRGYIDRHGLASPARAWLGKFVG